MSNFVIFEDQENVHEKAAGIASDVRRERQKLAPLTNKAINNENAFENQVRSQMFAALLSLLSFYSSIR
jgi:hypothetical protein